jgi:hypothetical protein
LYATAAGASRPPLLFASSAAPAPSGGFLLELELQPIHLHERTARRLSEAGARLVDLATVSTRVFERPSRGGYTGEAKHPGR